MDMLDAMIILNQPSELDIWTILFQTQKSWPMKRYSNRYSYNF